MALGQEAILQEGSSGLLVRQLQEKLAGAGFSPGPIDGIYGPNTKAAVIRLQQARGITPDGIAGPQVWVALSPPPPPPPPMSEERIAPLQSTFFGFSMMETALMIGAGMLFVSLAMQGRR